jgi:hypothetical protein
MVKGKRGFLPDLQDRIDQCLTAVFNMHWNRESLTARNLNRWALISRRNRKKRSTTHGVRAVGISKIKEGLQNELASNPDIVSVMLGSGGFAKIVFPACVLLVFRY